MATAIALIADSVPKDFPLVVFTVSCTILIAVIALPQVASGLSSSYIAKSLAPEFYKNWHQWLYLSFQAILALFSLISIIASNQKGVCPSPYSRCLLFLIVWDFAWGFFYLIRVRTFIESPEDMLNIYLERIKKIGRQDKEKAKEVFLLELKNIGRIGRYTTMSYEKSQILKAIEKLWDFVTDQEVPNALKNKSNFWLAQKSREFIPFVIAYPFPAKSDIPLNFASILDKATINEQKSVPTAKQKESWECLIECVTDACTINNELYSANKTNILEALEVLQKAWQKMTSWEKSDFTYAELPILVTNIALYSIAKCYNECVEKAVTILAGSVMEYIPNSKPHYISPHDIAVFMGEIGVSAVKAGKHDLPDQIFLYMLLFYSIADENTNQSGIDWNKSGNFFLFEALNLMSFVWDNNNDALESLCQRLEGIDNEQIVETVKNGSKYFPIDTTRIKRFFKAVDNFNASGKNIFQKLRELWKKL